MDPLQWMGAVRTGVQTTDKNIIIILSTTLINVLWIEQLCVCNKKSIIKALNI